MNNSTSNNKKEISTAYLYPVVHDLSEMEYGNPHGNAASAAVATNSPTSVTVNRSIFESADCCCFAGDNLRSPFYYGYKDDDDGIREHSNSDTGTDHWGSFMRGLTNHPLLGGGTETETANNSRSTIVAEASRQQQQQKQPPKTTAKSAHHRKVTSQLVVATTFLGDSSTLTEDADPTTIHEEQVVSLEAPLRILKAPSTKSSLPPTFEDIYVLTRQVSLCK
jgi:hypothetical protein